MNERALFEAALEIRDPGERSAYLDLACVNQPELRSRMAELLQAHDAAGSFLNVPAAGHTSPPDRTTDFSFQPTSVDDADDDKISLSFLQPSTQPGSLGKLAHYEILQILGQGAFGIVFKGFDEKLHRVIAIKVMHPQLAATSPPRKRFLREARSAAAVQHENIVQVHSVEEQPLPYLSMEFIDGETLQQKLDGVGPLSTAEVLHLSRQIAAGLAAAHEKGLIHRDIKPGNILLERGPEQKVKITDFGLARAADDASMTQSGVVCGTPMYMAPEQAQGQTLDHRADLFSFGSVLYQMACGRPPFRAPTAIAVLRRVAEETPRPLREVLSEVPDWLAAIVEKLHAKNPDERYQSAKEVRDLLGKCQTELQLHGKVTCVALPAPPVQAVVAPSPAVVPSLVVATPKSKPSRAPLAIVAALLLLLGVIIITITNKDVTNTVIKVPDDAKVEITSSEIENRKSEIENIPGWHGWPADAPAPAIAPFDAERAKQHQRAWAEYLKLPVEYTNSLGMKFVLIPPGEFTMGSTMEEIKETLQTIHSGDKHWRDVVASETPAHRVILSRPIYVAIHEVTQNQFRTIMGTNPSFFSDTGPDKERNRIGSTDTSNHPVEGVNWNVAVQFCLALSNAEKLKSSSTPEDEQPALIGTHGYRLPTEAEWEYACRAGTQTKYWTGNDAEELRKGAWFEGISTGITPPVGSLQANPFGLYDTHGSVWEWVQDCWDPTYYQQFAYQPAINPTGPIYPTQHRIFRGGRLLDDPARCRSAVRHALASSFNTDYFGFRPALTVDAVRQALKVTGPAMPKRPKLSVTDGSTSSTAKPLTPLPQLDLNETDPLPAWELPAGAPLPVVAPCEPQQATALQQQWAEFLKRPVIEELDVAALAVAEVVRLRKDGDDKPTNPRTENAATKDSQTLKFALIPPGEFRKIFTRPRDPAIEPDMPVRRFRITKPYALSTTEVTWDQFRQFVEATGYQTEAETNGLGGRDREFDPDPKINWRTPGWKPAPNEPVTQVTPRDAEAFCAWLTEAEQRKLPSDAGDDTNTKTTRRLAPLGYYRLPTEAEWVHACRAGSVHKHVVGPEPGDLADYAWTQEFLDPNPQASPLHLVGQKKPNPFGLHDTLGNVWEYTRDSLSLTLVPYLGTNDPLSYGSGTIAGNAWSDANATVHPDWGHPGFTTATMNVGFRVLKQFDGERLPGPLDRPLVLRAGQPMSVHALVPRPETIPGLQSWSIELANGHGTSLFSPIAANPNGDLIAMGSLYGKISLWDRDGNYQRTLLGHEGQITSLDFSPDGRWLASGEVAGAERGPVMGCTVRIWDVATGAIHAVIPSPAGQTFGVRFSPDGKQLAVSIDAQYQTSFFIVDLATGRTRLPATGEQRGRGLAWSPDSTKLASSATDGGKPSRLRIWDAATLKMLQDVECPLSASLEWSPDGQSLAMQGSDGKVAIRDAKTLAITKTFDANLLGFSSHALAWLPDSKRLAASAGDQGGVFDTETGERLAKFNAGNSAITLLDEGKQAVFESYGRLHFYDTSTGQKLREGKERGISYGQSILSPNGEEVITQGNIVVAFDAKTGERKTTSQFPSMGSHY